MDRIGVRELRQHASRYLERVEHGESLEITDRGRLVAHLVPATADPWNDRVATGGVAVHTDEVDLADEPPADYGLDASGALADLRSDER